MFICLLLQHSQKLNIFFKICCYLLSFFCMPKKVIVLSKTYYITLPEQKMQMAYYKNAIQIKFDSTAQMVPCQLGEATNGSKLEFGAGK